MTFKKYLGNFFINNAIPMKQYLKKSSLNKTCNFYIINATPMRQYTSNESSSNKTFKSIEIFDLPSTQSLTSIL